MRRPATVVFALLILAVPAARPPAQGAEEPIGEAIRDIPIFDAHVHYKAEAWGPYPPGTVIGLMDKAGVAMALVSSTPDDGTIKLLEFAPKRIVPELRPYHGEAGSTNWTHADGMLDYIQDRLARHPHEGIGEFHIHALDRADASLLRAVAKLAIGKKIPLHVHSDAGPVKFLYELQPSLTIIWAHAGMSEPPDVIGAMMDRYPTLHADTSYREHDILGGQGSIDPAWKAILLRHSGRFLVGSDTWVNAQWDQYESLIQLNRNWLKLLPRAVAEKIAYGNAERLFGRSIKKDLIGTQ
ncbi:MAG: amidohydrolase family protein [Methyloligellaceae bacterium]